MIQEETRGEKGMSTVSIAASSDTGPCTTDTQALIQAWRQVKAEADRLWWRLHRHRVNAKRRQRYREDAVYRNKVRARARLRAQTLRKRERESKGAVSV
jgi:hypothetical protein